MEPELKRKLRGVEDRLASVKEKMKSLRREERLLLSERTELELKLKETKDADICARTREDWSGERFPWSPQVRELLSRFDLNEFRPFQLESINVIMSGHDLLLIMPTGGGKSLCYQIPSLARRGVCLVVSPLLSLMEDQTFSLSRLGVPCECLSASTPREDSAAIHRALFDPSSPLKILFVTPERVGKSKKLISCLEKAYAQSLLSLIVVDEVHCASQWGHDFRPDYKKLCIFKLQFPSVPILGLTATATAHVVKDVEEILGLSCPRLFRAGFNRRNLFYEVRPKPDHFLKQVDTLVEMVESEFPGESGIVYCLSKKDCEKVALQLRERGLGAACYHADVPPHVRKEVHLEWLSGHILIVVSTVAFGLGIDKKNVRFVIHHSLAKSVASYYQECGRAGRDGSPARCVLLYRPQDYFSHSCMAFTERTGISNLDAMTRYCQDGATCRRALLSQHFSEPFRAEECGDMCDNCFVQHSSLAAAVPSSTVRVTHVYEVMLELIGLANTRKERLTAAKLLASWKKQCKSESSQLSDYKCMCIIIQGVLEGVFREDYHFTPYNTISYLLAGPYADSLLCDTDRCHQGMLDRLGVKEKCYEQLVPLLKSHLARFSTKFCLSPRQQYSSGSLVPLTKASIVISDDDCSESEEDCRFKRKRVCPENNVISCDD